MYKVYADVHCCAKVLRLSCVVVMFMCMCEYVLYVCLKCWCVSWGLGHDSLGKEIVTECVNPGLDDMNWTEITDQLSLYCMWMGNFIRCLLIKKNCDFSSEEKQTAN